MSLPYKPFVGCCASTAATRARETHLDGKWLLRTSDQTLTPDDLAAPYKQLIASNAASGT